MNCWLAVVPLGLLLIGVIWGCRTAVKRRDNGGG
jgi:hypothetical protein